jgi:hypothetical protein
MHIHAVKRLHSDVNSIGFLVKRAIEGVDPLSPEALNTKPKDAEVVIFKNGKMRGLLHAGIKVAVFMLCLSIDQAC